MPFEEYVSLGLSQLGDPFRVELADHFEVSEATVNRWASGVANPHPKLRVLVVGYIRTKAWKYITPSILNSAESAHFSWADNPNEARTATQMMVDWLEELLKG